MSDGFLKNYVPALMREHERQRAEQEEHLRELTARFEQAQQAARRDHLAHQERARVALADQHQQDLAAVLRDGPLVTQMRLLCPEVCRYAERIKTEQSVRDGDFELKLARASLNAHGMQLDKDMRGWRSRNLSDEDMRDLISRAEKFLSQAKAWYAE